MLASKSRVELAMARSCLNLTDLAESAQMPLPTVKNVLRGRGVKPATLGKVAKALGVDVSEIMESGA